MYNYIAAFPKLQKEEANDLRRVRLVQWRKETSITKIDRPTRLDAARRRGYKPKQSVVLVRVKVSRGSRRLHRPTKGRRSKRMMTEKITANFSRQTIAENRAARAYDNLEVLNSYWVAEDGRNRYFEVIMVDPFHPVIKSDKNFSWLLKSGGLRVRQNQKGRSFRGLTSSARKSRGLRRKGIGAERFRGRIRR